MCIRDRIVGEVSRTFNVSPADIRGTKRNANVASARRVAIYIPVSYTHLDVYKRQGIHSEAFVALV